MNKPYLSPSKLAALAALLLAIPHTAARADSLWHTGRVRPLVSDKRAVAIGDILSVVVQENNSTTKDTSTKTSKSSALDASINTFLYSPQASTLLTKGGKLPAINLKAKNDFDGGGTINNSERIIARIAVQVIDVLPNENLVIEGRRQTSFAGESQDVVLRGIVRPADVAANNTVFSYNIADATIKFVSKGSISSAQKKGWFTKLWDKFTPF